MPSRIQRRRTPGWRIPEGAVNVSRPCDWSNPFRIGDEIGPPNFRDDHTPSLVITRVLAIELFRAYVAERGWVDQIRRELAGRDLVCWCPLTLPCHADVLLEIANPTPQQTFTAGPVPERRTRIIVLDRPRRHS